MALNLTPWQGEHGVEGFWLWLRKCNIKTWGLETGDLPLKPGQLGTWGRCCYRYFPPLQSGGPDGTAVTILGCERIRCDSHVHHLSTCKPGMMFIRELLNCLSFDSHSKGETTQQKWATCFFLLNPLLPPFSFLKVCTKPYILKVTLA